MTAEPAAESTNHLLGLLRNALDNVPAIYSDQDLLDIHMHAPMQYATALPLLTEKNPPPTFLLEEPMSTEEPEESSSFQMQPQDCLSLLADPHSKMHTIKHMYDVPQEPWELSGFRTFTITQLIEFSKDLDGNALAAFVVDPNAADLLKNILHTALTQDIAAWEANLYRVQGMVARGAIEEDRMSARQRVTLSSGRALIDFYTEMRKEVVNSSTHGGGSFREDPIHTSS